jgi:hypothetical protein
MQFQGKVKPKTIAYIFRPSARSMSIGNTHYVAPFESPWLKRLVHGIKRCQPDTDTRKAEPISRQTLVNLFNKGWLRFRRRHQLFDSLQSCLGWVLTIRRVYLLPQGPAWKLQLYQDKTHSIRHYSRRELRVCNSAQQDRSRPQRSRNLLHMIKYALYILHPGIFSSPTSIPLRTFSWIPCVIVSKISATNDHFAIRATVFAEVRLSTPPIMEFSTATYNA